VRDAEARFAGSTQGARRRGLAVACASLLSVAALLTGVGSAQAAVVHEYVKAVPLTDYPVSVAVDKQTGSVYVLGAFPSRLFKFDADGNPSNFSSLGSNEINLTTPLNFGEPRQVAVDNSGGVNQGVIYIGNTKYSPTSALLVYMPSGDLAAEFHKDSNEDEGFNPNEYCGVAVSNGGDFFAVHPGGLFHNGGYIDKFHPGQWIPGSSPPQKWPISGTGEVVGTEHCKIDVDSTNAYFLARGGIFGSGPLEKFPASAFNVEVPHGKVFDPNVHGFSVDRATNDVYGVRESDVARFDSNGVLRETFASGKFEFGTSVGVNPISKNVYVGAIVVGGNEEPQIQLYKGVTVPDVTNVSAQPHQTVADLSATIGTAGAGNVTKCELEYGTSLPYASKAPCSPGTPYSSQKAISVHLEGLSKETTYHYRFVAGNANGTLNDVDGTFTTHNVADVKTEEPTNVTQTSATLNGSYNGSTTNTPPFYTLTNYLYYFEWGTAAGVYTHKTAAPPGVDAGAHSGIFHVSADITGLTTYLPESSAYHYRLVVTNEAGTTYGQDVAFFSAPPDPPAISGMTIEEVSTTGAKVGAQVNPNNGDTVYTVEYGANPYESFTPISESIGDDNTDHPVSAALTGLEPGTKYHYRVVAINFGGTSYSSDGVFTTESGPPPVEPPPAGNQQQQQQPPTEVQPPSGGGKKCRKGFVKRHGKCVRKHRKRKHHG
jgi:hypothetical protein